MLVSRRAANSHFPFWFRGDEKINQIDFIVRGLIIFSGVGEGNRFIGTDPVSPEFTKKKKRIREGGTRSFNSVISRTGWRTPGTGPLRKE